MRPCACLTPDRAGVFGRGALDSGMTKSLSSQLTIGVCLLLGCGEKSESSLSAELDQLEQESNARAREVCGASESEIEQDDPDTEAASCYFELALDLESCEREGLQSDPENARLLLACIERDNEALIACCREGGDCTYAKIESCYEELWDGDSSGECAADESSIEAAIDACEADSES